MSLFKRRGGASIRCKAARLGQCSGMTLDAAATVPKVKRVGSLVRTLKVVGVVALGAVVVMAGAGLVIARLASTHGKPFSVTVLNDRGSAVALQPCARFFCTRFRPIELPSGVSHTWRTDTSDAGVHSFVVEAAPDGRILGCLDQHALTAVGRVSELQTCVN